MKSVMIAAVIALFAVASWALPNDKPASKDKVNARLEKATEIIREMTGPNAKAGIPESVLQNAKCIAVVPNMIQGGFIVGGHHGDGVATCRIEGNRWSPPAPLQVTGASWGAQIGGQSIDLVMMVMNQEGMQALQAGHFKLGGEVSGAAGPVGRQAEASGGWKAAILTYSRAKGVYAGATIKGAELQKDEGATQALYGRDENFSAILNGQVPAPNNVQARDFVNAIEHAQQVARAK